MLHVVRLELIVVGLLDDADGVKHSLLADTGLATQ